MAAADPGPTAGTLVMVARDGSRGVKLAYQAAGDAVGRAEGEPPTHLEILSGNDPVPVALAVGLGSAGPPGMLLADGLTAAPFDVRAAAALPDAVSTVACARGAPKGQCRCGSFATCTRRVIGRGGGMKLVCRGATVSPCTPEKGPCFGEAGCILDALRDQDGGLIVCAGDSNTFPPKPRWCQPLGAWLDGFETMPTGWPGSRASDDPGLKAAPNVILSARPYLENMLGWPTRPNLVILAWGTNDIPVHTAKQITHAVDRLVQLMRRAGVVPLVATVPWRHWGGFAPKIAALNGLLAARYGPCLIDFTTITPATASWYVDRVHLDPAAQERRAIAATYALKTLPRSCAAGVASRKE